MIYMKKLFKFHYVLLVLEYGQQKEFWLKLYPKTNFNYRVSDEK